MFGVNEVESMNMAKPRKQHWLLIKWITRHLVVSCHKGLKFRNSDPNGDMVVGFVDSDFARSLNNKKS